MSHRQGFTRASSLGPIANFVAQQGGSIDRVFQTVDLPIEILNQPNLLIPLPDQFRILKSAARELGDECFGVSLGQHVRIRELSDFGRWVADAATLSEAIARSNGGLNIYLQTATTLQLEIMGTTARWSIEFLDKGREGRFQNELLGISYLIEAVRNFLGRNWTPDQIKSTASTTKQASRLEQIYNCPVRPAEPVSAIEFPVSLLQDCAAFQSECHQTACHDGTAHQPQTTSFIPSETRQYETIQAVTRIASLTAYPKIDQVAARLGMTRRTLQRRLKENQTTFKKMVEDLLHQRARELLQSPHYPIIEIAYDLGYQDPGHFSRAFKRWSGHSPNHYRRQQAGL